MSKWYGRGWRERAAETNPLRFSKTPACQGNEYHGRRDKPHFKLNLYSFQTDWIYLCKAGRRALSLKVKGGLRNGPAHLLPFLPLQLTQGIDCWGDTHLIPTDDHGWGERGKTPELPANLPWGKWLPGLELTFTSGLFMQLRVTLFGSETQFIPSLYWLWR